MFGKNPCGEYTSNSVFSLFSSRAVRLLLSVSVSVWMAGGCLLGCSSTAAGAESKHLATTIAAGQSCHAKHTKQSTGVPSFVPGPHGVPKDCPLVVNATAATSKSNGQLPALGRGPVSAPPVVSNTTVQSNTSLVVSYLPNRGPTHLRCCVFLI